MSVTIINLSPRESECVVCGRQLFECTNGIAMYEGCAVPHGWKHDWAGFDACQECFDRNERGEMPTWPNKPNQ
jgi:hypothetical protein